MIVLERPGGDGGRLHQAPGAGTEAGATWDEIRPALAGALENPANLEGTSEAFGGMPKQQIVGLLITDLLLHSWDLARSIGADETLPPAAVDAAMMGKAPSPPGPEPGPRRPARTAS